MGWAPSGWPWPRAGNRATRLIKIVKSAEPATLRSASDRNAESRDRLRLKIGRH